MCGASAQVVHLADNGWSCLPTRGGAPCRKFAELLADNNWISIP